MEIYYDVFGAGDETLVFVGGWGVPTAVEVWKHQLSFSSKYKLVLLDLAGHGKSGKNRENYTMELFAHDVKSVIEDLDLTNILLIGHSMGGPVILEVERLISERITGLIAIDSLFLIPESSYAGHEDQSVKEFVKPLENDFIGTVRTMFKSMLSDKMNLQDIEAIEKTPDLLDKRSMVSAMAELQRWDMRKTLPHISKPLKCIVAGKSLSREYRAEYNQVFDAVYLEDLGHLLFLEDPILFNKSLEACISELVN